MTSSLMQLFEMQTVLARAREWSLDYFKIKDGNSSKDITKSDGEDRELRDINIKGKTFKLLKENTEYFCDLGGGKNLK